jgi:hypothetical protein
MRFFRFLYQTGHYSASRPKASGLMPNRGRDGRLEISTFELSGLTEDAVWHHCDAFGRNDKVARAAAVLDEPSISESGLAPQISEPPPRHWRLVGWPGDDGQDAKDQQKAMAQALAARAALVTRPT